jgi:hypothetical protein
MSNDAEPTDAEQQPKKPRDSSWAYVVAFLLFLWLAIETLTMTRLGTNGSTVFPSAPSYTPPKPTAK